MNAHIRKKLSDEDIRRLKEAHSRPVSGRLLDVIITRARFSNTPSFSGIFQGTVNSTVDQVISRRCYLSVDMEFMFEYLLGFDANLGVLNS